MKILYKSIVMSIVIFSCSNPDSKKFYKISSVEEDTKMLVESKIWSHEDAELVESWIFLLEGEGKSPSGKTYKQILKDAKEFEKKEKERIETKNAKKKLEELKAKKEEQEKIKKFKNAVFFSLSDKKISKINEDYLGKDVIELIGHVENKSDKDIRALKGILHIYDIFGEEINSFELSVERTVKSKDTISVWYQIKRPYLQDWFNKLKEKKLEDLKYDFVPNKIIYTDGTEL